MPGERNGSNLLAPLAGWLFGLGAFAIAFVVRWRFGAAMEGLPFVTFFLAVLATALLAGWRPATAVAALSFFTAWYAFLPPFGSFALTWPTGHVALGFFVIVCAAQIATVARLQAALGKLRQERRRVNELLAHQHTLYAELQHRVANSIQSLASILSLQASRIAGAEDAEEAVRDAAARLLSVAAVHRQLHDPDLGAEGFARALRNVVEGQLRAAGREDVSLGIEITTGSLPQQDATLIAMIVAEAVTNALKHGIREKEEARIFVALRDERDGRRVLEITDDGTGFAQLPVPPAASLGLVIMDGFAKRLGGTLALSNAPAAGARVRVEIPPENLAGAQASRSDSARRGPSASQ
jgi:two-component sensor histidine kinase